ncbi:hypothetical protein FRB99_007096 [Tulasnella sp. 403]|nr:hypothetical protein FRB99_007096 [Tulasnella sp. 403]
MAPFSGSTQKVAPPKRLAGQRLTFDSLKLHYVSGGYGEIFFANHESLGKIALKRLYMCYKEAQILEREVSIWQSLSHRHILPLLGVYEDSGLLYMASPYMHNGTSDEYITRYPDVDRPRLLCEIADAGKYLHGMGIIHGDIRPQNILIDLGIRALLFDFGLSRRSTEAELPELQGGGTPCQGSPEILKGGPTSLQGDVYAFGITVYQNIEAHFPALEASATFSRFRLSRRSPPINQTSPPALDVTSSTADNGRTVSLSSTVRARLLTVLDTVRPPFSGTNSSSDTAWFAYGLAQDQLIQRAEIKFDRAKPVQLPTPGGFCKLFRGKLKGHGGVALKLLDICRLRAEEQAVEPFKAELFAWRSLSHLNVLKFLGPYMEDGQLYLVSPWAENGSVLEYLKRSPDADRQNIIAETALGLQYIHGQNFVHGDIKAQNILMSAEPRPLICDFGLSRLQSITTLPLLRGAGSARWNSPELWKGEPKSMKSDVYAFGITVSQASSRFLRPGGAD